MFFTMENYAKEFEKIALYILRERPDFHERNVLMSMSYLFGGTYSCCNRKDCSYGWVGVGPNGYHSHCDTLSYGSLGFKTIFDYEAITDFQYTEAYDNIVRLRKNYRTEKCAKCMIADICPGTCFSNTLNNANNGLAINQNACDDLAYSMFAVYRALRNVDIYKENFNGIIVQSLLSNDYYTIMEIRDVIQSMFNVDIYELDAKSTDSPQRLFVSNEFKIFRLINPAVIRKGLRVASFNTVRIYEDELGECASKLTELGLAEIRARRRMAIVKSVEKNKDKILKLIGKE